MALRWAPGPYGASESWIGDVSIGGAIKGGAFRGLMLAERIALGSFGAGCRWLISRTFLLLQHSTALGAVVHATPLVAALEEAVPGCRIVVAASGMAVEIFRRQSQRSRRSIEDCRARCRIGEGAGAALRRLNPLRGEAFATIDDGGRMNARVLRSAGGPEWGG